MVILGWFVKLKNYVCTSRLTRRDLVLLVLLLPCLVLLYLAWSGGVFSARRTYPVSQGYQARQQDGWVYVLDSGHSTLTKASPEGRIAWRLSPGLYVDGFTLGEDGSVCLNASLFSGMTVAGERILRYDGDGNGPQVLLERDYGEALSKHALHGAGEQEGRVRFIECGEDKIVSHCVDLGDLSRSERVFAYPDAFNAVSDAAFFGEILYVLDRNGTLTRFSPEGEREEIYSVTGAGERGRVPYRLAVSDAGEVYFTDIRSRTVQRVLQEEGRSETAAADTDSVTADVRGAAGEEAFVLTAEGTVWLPRGTLTSFRSRTAPLLLLSLAIPLAVIAAVLALCLLARVYYVLIGAKTFQRKRAILATVAIGLATMALTGSILISGFRKTYTDKINEELIISSVSTANIIQARDVLSINEPADYGSEAYLRLSRAMENCFDRSVDFNRNTYCNILRWDGEGSAYAVAYLDGTIGTYYPLGDYETRETVTVYETKEPVVSDEFEDISGIYLGVKVPILDEAGNCVGVVSSGTQVVLLQALLRSMVFRALASILFFAIMVWFIVTEVIAYAMNRETYRRERQSRETKLPGHLLRLVLVLIFAAYNLQAAFLPGYIVHQMSPDTGNAALLASLPYTLNIFIFGVTAILCTWFMRRLGTVRLLVLSLAAALAGNLLIFLVPGYWSILAGMLLIGVGVGLVSNMMYVQLTYVKDNDDQVWGLSIYNAASMAGVNLGMVGGSILAVLLGQRAVFAAAALLWLLMLLLSVSLLRRMPRSGAVAGEAEKKKPGVSLRALFRDRLIPCFMICIQNPYIVFSSFAMYYLPIFCDARGYSETTSALMLLCYAELSILLGHTMVERSRRWMGNGAMYAAIGIDAAAMLVFALTENLAGMIVALVLMGLSASFGKPVQQLYYIHLPQVTRYGEDRAMGIYNFSENIGESLGPVIMGWLMFRTPLFPAVAGFCGVVALLGGAHALFVRRGKKSS